MDLGVIDCAFEEFGEHFELFQNISPILNIGEIILKQWRDRTLIQGCLRFLLGQESGQNVVQTYTQLVVMLLRFLTDPLCKTKVRLHLFTIV